VVPPAPVRVPNQRPLALSVASVTSVAIDKGDNGMIPGAVHRSLGICLMAEKTSARRPSVEQAVRLKWGSLPPNEVIMIA
jgi:hypothetical protein